MLQRLKKSLILVDESYFSNGAINTAHTRTAIKEFVENYDRVKEKYTHTI